MKNQKTQSKIIVAMSAVILLLVALSATLTFAWFTAQANNTQATATFGHLNFGESSLTLADGDASTADHRSAESDPIVPGCKLNLTGNVGVNTNINAFVRIKLAVSLGHIASEQFVAESTAYAASDTNVDDANVAILAQIVGKILTANTVATGKTANWIKNGDWLYFDTKVTPNDNQQNLITFENSTITLEGSLIPNTWQDKILKISIDAQAIQADHITYGENVDVPVTVTGVSAEDETNKITAANLASIFESQGFFGA